jgi:hypothetical protein
MHQPLRLLCLLALTAAFTGCASTEHWTVSNADRHEGLVRVSYEYPEFQQPTLSDSQAEKLAQGRCEGWGYDDAEPVSGQLRQCSNMANGDCDLWKVTREFQCTRQAAVADFAAR